MVCSSVREVCRESEAKWVVVEESRDCRDVCRDVRRVCCESIVVVGVVVETELERDLGGVVCVAMSLWKSSVGSESTESVSEVSVGLWRGGMYGTCETVDSSLSLRVVREDWVWEARLWRAVDRDSSMGCTRYLEAP